MQAHWIVTASDLTEAGHLGRGLEGEAVAAEELGFECGKEALSRGIVVGGANRCHGRPHASRAGLRAW